jgi:hypothetical protein
MRSSHVHFLHDASPSSKLRVWQARPSAPLAAPGVAHCRADFCSASASPPWPGVPIDLPSVPLTPEEPSSEIVPIPEAPSPGVPSRPVRRTCIGQYRSVHRRPCHQSALDRAVAGRLLQDCRRRWCRCHRFLRSANHRHRCSGRHYHPACLPCRHSRLDRDCREGPERPLPSGFAGVRPSLPSPATTSQRSIVSSAWSPAASSAIEEPPSFSASRAVMAKS